MQVTLEIDGIKCSASTDFVPDLPTRDDKAVAMSAMYVSMTQGIKDLANRLIEAKYGKRSDNA